MSVSNARKVKFCSTFAHAIIIGLSVWQRKVFSHLHNIQTTSEASPASYSFSTQGRASGAGSKSHIFLVPGLRMCGALCAVPPYSFIPSLCGA